eukprot:SAG11_NODE_26_length_23420_cov_40.459886_23_plen_40_part_00
MQITDKFYPPILTPILDTRRLIELMYPGTRYTSHVYYVV